MMAFAAGVAVVASPVLSQPPGGKEAKNGKDGKGEKGPPRFELGQVFPPPLLDELKLTPTQEKELEAIKKDLKAKLEKLLTADQKKTLENFRPRGPGGPGEKGGPSEKGGSGDKGGQIPDRPAFEKTTPPEKAPPPRVN
jgi:hypothetical protein